MANSASFIAVQYNIFSSAHYTSSPSDTKQTHTINIHIHVIAYDYNTWPIDI